MKRTLAIICSSVLALSIAPLASVANEPAPAASAVEARDARVATSCGELCVEGRFSNGARGAWFIDSTDSAVMVGYRSFSVVNTSTSKTIKAVSALRRTSIRAFALSSNKSHAVVSFSSGEVTVYDTENWQPRRVNATEPRQDVAVLAVSDSGNEVYMGRFDYGINRGALERWTASNLQETHTIDHAQGLGGLKLSNDDSTLYIGYLGAIPSLEAFDASNIDAGPTASDNSTKVYSVENIEITSDNRVFAANTSNRSIATDSEPRVMEYHPTTLVELDAYNTDEPEWQRWAIGLSSDESSIFAMGEFIAQGSPQQPSKIIEIDKETLEPLDGILEISDVAAASPFMVDVDPTGRYLLAATHVGTYLVSLVGGSFAPVVEYDYGTRIVSWDFLYLNPRAKFKWFEVKYRKQGSSKWTVKRVKRSMSKNVGEISLGADAIQVRAVYTRKRLNSSWGTADVSP